MNVLATLAKQAGKVVDTDYLLEHCWDIDYATENALYKVISELRAALQDTSSQYRIIKTVPKRGYTLQGKVKALASGSQQLYADQQMAMPPLITNSIAAGHKAHAEMALDLAQRHFTVALDMLSAMRTRGEPIDARLECDLKLWVGECCLVDRGKVAAAPWFKEAGELANQLQYAAGTARALLGESGSLQPLLDDEVANIISALRDAQIALAGQDALLENRLQSRLVSFERPVTRETRRQAAQIVTQARSLNDPITLAHALVAQHEVLSSADDLDGRLALSQALISVASETTDRDMVASGYTRRCADLLEAGRLKEATTIRQTFAAVEPTRLYRDDISRLNAAWELRAGNLKAAEDFALTITILETGPLLIQLLQLFLIRRWQGRVDELLPLIESLATQYPGIMTINAHLALGYAETGDFEAAHTVLRRLGTVTVEEIARDISWNATLVALVETTVLLNDTEQIDTLIKLVKPFEGNHLVQGAVCYFGAADYYLGLLYLAQGKPKEAAHYFDEALLAHRAMQSPPMQAKTLSALHTIALAMGDDTSAKAQALKISRLASKAKASGWVIPKIS